MVQRIVYLMRGLPGCGKSFTARRLAGETGLVLETDQYFYSQVGDDPTHYDYHEALLPEAREWIFGRYQAAIEQSVTPIILDRGNGRNPETRRFAEYAVSNGYQIELREPESEWWQELRVLLKYRSFVEDSLLDAWARRLSDSTRDGHRVPMNTIRHWMNQWRSDLTVDDILRA